MEQCAAGKIPFITLVIGHKGIKKLEKDVKRGEAEEVLSGIRNSAYPSSMKGGEETACFPFLLLLLKGMEVNLVNLLEP